MTISRRDKLIMDVFRYVTICLMLLVMPIRATAVEINRDILAIYDGSDIKGEDDNLIHSFAEMPLEHLGFKLHYVDVSKTLPDDQEMTKYGGIISWFADNKLTNAPGYIRWITRQIKNGKKYVLIDEFGFDFDEKMNPTPEDLKDEFFKAFHVIHSSDESTRSPLLIEIAHNDPEMTEFERSLKGSLNFFDKTKVMDEDADVYLKLKRKDTGSTGDAIFVNSKGGMVVGDYAVYYNPINFQTRWRINPFKFFSRAFGADFPKPDVTTINGMRLLYSHIDGDGMRNVCSAKEKTFCTETTCKKILTQYKLPITVSVIAGEIMKIHGDERERLTRNIRDIFALPNIEPASHGMAHPFIWEVSRRKMALKLDEYEYSPENEIGKSISFINENLAPKGKSTDLFLWTGNCLPDHDALKYVHDHRIMNLNGGDTRFDNKYPSYTFVAPLFRHVDGLLQYYASSANEDVYTNVWTGPFYAYEYVIETFKRTESPIRIRSIDIYYHFYTMERQVATDALKKAYNWSLMQEVTPIFASEYVRTVDGFLSTRIDKISDDRWVIMGNGDLRTIRVDDYDGNVDLVRSAGVIGFSRHNGSLYVHLDNGNRSEIYLTRVVPTKQYLVKANGYVKDWQAGNEGLKFKLRAMGRIQFIAGGMEANRKHTVHLKDVTFDLSSDDGGRLSVSRDVNNSGFEWIEVYIK